MSIKSQLELLKESSWNNLIILDACRYEYFCRAVEESNFSGLLKNLDSLDVEAVNSHVFNTTQWYTTRNSVLNFDDIILIGGHPNPFIAANGIENVRTNYPFKKAYAIFAPDDNVTSLGTVPPNVMIENIHKYRKNGNRYIMHFAQPHLPFAEPSGEKFLKEITDKEISHGGISVYDTIRMYGRTCGWEDIIEYYVKDIKYALKEIDKLELDNVVITADHSEILGENGTYGHNSRSEKLNEILKEVPWVEIK